MDLSTNEKITIEKWLESKKTQTRAPYSTAINIFFDYLQIQPEDVTADDIGKYTKHMFTLKENGIWSESYVRMQMYAIRSYIVYRYDIERSNLLLDYLVPQTTLKPKTQAIEKSGVEEYLTHVLIKDRPLFTACVLAYGLLLAPKEIYSIRLSHFRKSGDRLVLSVGKGTNHRYIYVPKNIADVLTDYIERYNLPEDKDIFTGNSTIKGVSSRHFNTILNGLQYRYYIPGLEGKLGIQQLRTIALATVSRQVDYSKLVEYCKISRSYVFNVRPAYEQIENPIDIIGNVWNTCENKFTSTSYNFLPIEEDKYIVEHPLEFDN